MTVSFKLGCSTTLGWNFLKILVIPVEGDLVTSIEFERFKYFNVCSSLKKSMPGASHAATWGWFCRFPGLMVSLSHT